MTEQKRRYWAWKQHHRIDMDLEFGDIKQYLELVDRFLRESAVSGKTAGGIVGTAGAYG